MPVSISFQNVEKIVIFCWIKSNRNGQIHVLGTHETLPKYTSQACDAQQSLSLWLVEICVAGKQLAHTRCTINTRPHDYVLSNQIV